MREADPAIDREGEALAWVIRSQQETFLAWDELNDWMQADMRNAEAFNRLALRDVEIAEAVRQSHIAKNASPSMPTARHAAPPRRRLAAWAMAASLLVAVGGSAILLRHERPSRAIHGAEWAIKTAPGEIGTAKLRDGSTIVVAGNSRLSIDRAQDRVTLDYGQASFAIVHDPSRSLVISAGPLTITDIGTSFDVRHRADGSEVSLATGSLSIHAQGADHPLAPGHRLSIVDGRIAIGGIPAAEIGEWREGRLTYDEATTVARIARDVADMTGTRIEVAPAVATRQFAGTIRVPQGANPDLRELVAALGLTATRNGANWVIGPDSDAPQP